MLPLPAEGEGAGIGLPRSLCQGIIYESPPFPFSSHVTAALGSAEGVPHSSVPSLQHRFGVGKSGAMECCQPYPVLGFGQAGCRARALLSHHHCCALVFVLNKLIQSRRSPGQAKLCSVCAWLWQGVGGPGEPTSPRRQPEMGAAACGASAPESRVTAALGSA